MSTPGHDNPFDSNLIAELARLRQSIDETLNAYEEFRKKLAGLPPEIAERIKSGKAPDISRSSPVRLVRSERTPEARKKPTGKTHFEQVVDYLRSVDNAPQSAREIIDATGLDRGNVTLMLYKSHKDQFVRVEEGPRRVRWKLAD